MIYREMLDKVTDHFSREERYLKEIVEAKELFFVKTGKVFEDDPFYETRMAAFVEWFMLDRPMQRVGLTPVRYYYELFEQSLRNDSPESIVQLRSLMSSLHSLFLFKSKHSDTVLVEDLFDGKEYRISEKRQYVGIHRGSIFEGRIVRKDDKFFFSDAYCIHPFDANTIIRKEIDRRLETDRDEFLEFIFSLAGLRLRCDRYKKVDVASIYDFKGGNGAPKGIPATPNVAS